ncbi:MAG: ACT domain-containing protein [Candidatus Bathyarchaeota archaeon]|nr:ACT domain-containing protein [Candidatus Bathyarchaeota archaeon]
MVELSLAKVVQYLIEGDPSIQDAIERGYANLSAVARLLKPKAEEILGRRVTLEGMVTSVKRVRVRFKPLKGQLKVVADSIITIRTSLAKISLEKTRRNLEKARLISAEFPEAFFQVLEGATTLTLITDQRIFEDVRLKLEVSEILDEKRNLAAVIIQSPREIVDTPGCITIFYNALSRKGINIEETISCYTETVIVVRMEDSTRVYSILADLVLDARKRLGFTNF